MSQRRTLLPALACYLLATPIGAAEAQPPAQVTESTHRQTAPPERELMMLRYATRHAVTRTTLPSVKPLRLTGDLEQLGVAQKAELPLLPDRRWKIGRLLGR